MTPLPQTVVGPRLVLRRWRPEDVAILRAAIEANTEHLRPWMPWIAREPLDDEVRRELLVGWEDDWRAGGDVHLGAFLGHDLVGGCGLHRRAGPDVLEIGYWVDVEHLRRGYATEMAGALTDAALAVPGIARVEIHHDEANSASRGVPEALGFRLDRRDPAEPAAPADVGVQVVWSTSEPCRIEP